MAEIPVKLDKKQEEALVHMMKKSWEEFPYDDMRTRMKKIDLSYMREQQSQLRDDRLKTTQIQPTVVPIVQPQVDTLTAQLVGMFLKGQPIFSISSAPENEQAVIGMNALLKQHSSISAYPAQFILWLKAASRYNLCAMEVDWTVQNEITFGSGIEGNEAIVSESQMYYNKLKNISVYNLFFDTNVRPSEVHRRGEYAGYHEVVGRIELKQMLAGLDKKATRNFREAFESQMDDTSYVYEPEILSIDEKLKQDVQNGMSMDWESFFGQRKTGGIRYRNRYILTTLYIKMLPSDINLAIPQPNTPRIFKLLIVNGKHLVYAELQTAAHNLLPIVLGQLFDDGLGLQTKSFVENLEPIQNLVSQLHTARVADLARAIADRGFYDPSLVDQRTINSPNPAAKMPVKPMAYGRLGTVRVFEPMPYRNESAGNLIQEAQLVTKYGEDVGGLNPVQRGAFVKGNKTLGEFNEVMGNADERTQVVFMMLHAQSIVPMQDMIKSNLLQYHPPKEVYDPESKRMVQYSPATMRKVPFTFDVADGLVPQSLLRNPEMLSSALQFIASSPQMAQEYDMVGLFAHIFNVRGATDLNSFKYTEEQKIQRYQQQLAQTRGMTIAQTPPQSGTA